MFAVAVLARRVGALRQTRLSRAGAPVWTTCESQRQSIGISAGEVIASRRTGKYVRLGQAGDGGCGRRIDCDRGVCD